MFLLGIWTKLAKRQIELVSIAQAAQWIYVMNIHDVLIPQNPLVTSIYEPLILAIGISQMLLGGSAVVSGIRKLASINTPSGTGGCSALRSCNAVSKDQIQTER
jgi:hypothetical protein